MRTWIPDAYLDLADGPPVAALTTVMPDGQPQTTVVWCSFDGTYMLVNPKVSLLVVDPQNTARYLAIRGEAELIEDGALEQLEQLTRRYTPYLHYYGFIYPLEQQVHETRIICRIHAAKIILGAIHP